MYVIYPAEELLRIYESPIRSLNYSPIIPKNRINGEASSASTRATSLVNCCSSDNANIDLNSLNSCKNSRRSKSVKNSRFFVFESKRGRCREKENSRNYPIMQNNRSNGEEGCNPLKELTHANLNESLKQHNGNALKLVQTVSEFAQELGTAMDLHGANMRRLVDEFRSRSGEMRGDVGGMKRIWENLLRQVETDASSHLDLATTLKQLSRPTLEASFPKKLQSRKVFAHREAYEQVVSKTEEKLQKARLTYRRAYDAFLKCGTGESPSVSTNATTEDESSALRRAYIDSHNAYVLQLHATNALNEYYQLHCLPSLLGELSEIYEELSNLACKCITEISEASNERASEQSRRYQSLTKEGHAIIPQSDLQSLARNLSSISAAKKPPRRLFVAPAPADQMPPDRINSVPILKDEIVPTGAPTDQDTFEELRREADDLTLKIGRLRDSLDASTRIQRKSAEGSLFTKVAELQEDISMKRFDLGVAHLHLAAVQAQKELFGTSDIGPLDGINNRKMSNGSTGSNTKHKWLKAFKSLKTSSPTTTGDKSKQTMYHAVSTVVAMSRKNLESEGGHQWREYTYRKITPCDACGQVLRGHSRQGLRCRGCKVNAHADCISLVQPSNCPSLAPKRAGGIPLLRRQKMTAHADETLTEHSVDATYQVLKQAGEIRGNATNSPPTPPTVDHGSSGGPLSARSAATSHPCSSSTSDIMKHEAPHSPQRRRERLNLRMKSLSLDSPEGTAHVRHRPRDYNTNQKDGTPPRHSDSSSINRLSPCSSTQMAHRHARGAIRMSSMELPDDNEKSYSSASTSPCPSPHMNNQNHLGLPNKRVLPPNNLYVVLYNFEARHRDELDLKAGYKVTVIDKSEKDWWKGKCLGGRAGYFPSAYVMRVESGQKTLQVTRNLQLADSVTLLRDQIVIQVGEELDGIAMVRCAADTRSSGHVTEEGDVRSRETLCPLKYLQEV
ncbi:uncharacterized protein LOC107045752 isoform X2 [Diachasma alloeum]|uniref:uncharacterized protein LOC107045752 isoform X2 n=1 Tax=Diachasma alloeum TaxID=454923 RepID=UPI00073827BF|nr:uncharacterized protein LOC107045752 isoform X2 [Diachasma alloeum]